MNFAEFRFWVLLFSLLGGVLITRFLLRRLIDGFPDFDRWGLLFIGLSLLLGVSRISFLIFLVVALGTYFGLKWILHLHGRALRRYLFILIPLQFAPLFYYKYANFLANDVLSLNIDTLQRLLIPVGISFYTFQKVAFVLDTLAFRQPLPRLLDYMNFAAFFPQIVAGPIERRKNLLPQMQCFRFAWDAPAIDAGVSWIIIGLYFKCCLADNLADLFRPQSIDNAYAIWLNNLLFGLRIYYDFAGYSLIALGIARCLGVGLTFNFESPYSSTSMIEFWRRWHITLSQWFRDYLYVPLGGGRVPWWAANIMLVFLVSGVWHGAGWNFVLWGSLHGFFLIVNRLASQRWRTPAVLGWAATMIGTFLAWLCFYETRLPALAGKLHTLFTPSGYSIRNLSTAASSWSGGDTAVIICLLGLSGATLLVEWASLRQTPEPFAYFRKPAVLVSLVVLTIILAPGRTNGFIYFAF